MTENNIRFLGDMQPSIISPPSLWINPPLSLYQSFVGAYTQHHHNKSHLWVDVRSGLLLSLLPFLPNLRLLFLLSCFGRHPGNCTLPCYYLCLALPIYFSNVIRGWILISSFLCYERQWYFGFVFCCLSLSSFWPYCKIPKSKSILEDFRLKLAFLAYSPQLTRNFKSGSLLFLWRLPLACTVYRIQGWLVGAEFQESIEKKNRPNFRTPSLSLPDKLGNLRLWCFEHFLWEVALIMTAAVVLVKLMRRNTSENKRKQIEQTLQ